MSNTNTDTTVRELVDAPWLEDRLDDPGVCVIEVDVSPAAFDEGHIPGATLWNIYTDLKDSAYQPRSMAAIERLIGDSGIATASTVVFYGYAPALGFWLMKLCGHADVRILNTNRATWVAAGRPWTRQQATTEPTDYTIDTQSTAVRASRAVIDKALAAATHTVVDVRSTPEFVGERFWPSGGTPDGGRAGRIPGSVHAPADGLTRPDGSFAAPDELRRVFSSIPGRGDRGVITYCTVGARAATVWFALTYLLGCSNVQVYDGSWAQWGMSDLTPVAKG